MNRKRRDGDTITIIEKNKFIGNVFRVIALVLVFSVIGGGVYVWNRMIPTKKYVYDATACTNPKNPSRGMYVQLDSADADDLEKYSREVSLVLLAYDLYEYRDCELSQEKLDELTYFLACAKEKQIKCIFRPAYGFTREEQNDASSLVLIQRHIEQLAPIINEYKGQIYCVQAGLFGPWGEWHSSIYLEENQKDEDANNEDVNNEEANNEETNNDEANDNQAKENRNWLLRTLMDALDEDIVISVRRPRFIRDAVEGGIDAGIDADRLAYFDDGLLGSETDLGTYDGELTREEELQWVNQNLNTGIMGGEMPYYNAYSYADNADTEFAKLKLSYLNLKYNKEIYEQWKEATIAGENAYEYITARIGYRFRVSDISYPERITNGFFLPNQSITIHCVNEGYANIPCNYEAKFVLFTETGEYIFLDPEGEMLSSCMTGDTLELSLPAKILKEYEVCQVGLCFVDRLNPIVSDRSCVQLVNAEIPYQNGINILLTIDEEGYLLLP